MGKRLVSFRQRLEILEFMRTVVDSKEGDEWCVYKGNWDDASVAKHLGVGKGNVRGVRTEFFGKVRPYRVPHALRDTPQTAQLPFDIATLEARIEALELKIGSMDNTLRLHEHKIDGADKRLEPCEQSRSAQSALNEKTAETLKDQERQIRDLDSRFSRFARVYRRSGGE